MLTFEEIGLSLEILQATESSLMIKPEVSAPGTDVRSSIIGKGSVGVRLNGTGILFHWNETTLSCPLITFYKRISSVIDISQITYGNIDCIGNPDIRVIAAV